MNLVRLGLSRPIPRPANAPDLEPRRARSRAAVGTAELEPHRDPSGRPAAGTTELEPHREPATRVDLELSDLRREPATLLDLDNDPDSLARPS